MATIRIRSKYSITRFLLFVRSDVQTLITPGSYDIWTLQHGAPSALYFRFSSVIRTFWSDASLFRDVGEMLAKYLPQHEGDKTVLYSVLQSFLDELPQQGSDNIREDILGCNSGQQLRDLAHHLIFHILTPCIFLITSLTFVEVLSKFWLSFSLQWKQSRARTPSVEPSPRPGWAESVESVASEITSSERQQRWLRKACLERDGNRCMISGVYDFSESTKLPVGDPILNEPQEPFSTQAAHIVPFCCGSFNTAGVSAFS